MPSFVLTLCAYFPAISGSLTIVIQKYKNDKGENRKLFMRSNQGILLSFKFPKQQIATTNE